MPVDAPRTRRSFARLDHVLEVPNLIDIQRRSFDWLVDPEHGGLVLSALLTPLTNC